MKEKNMGKIFLKFYTMIQKSKQKEEEEKKMKNITIPLTLTSGL